MMRKSGLKRWWLWRKFWFKTNSLCSTMDCPALHVQWGWIIFNEKSYSYFFIGYSWKVPTIHSWIRLKSWQQATKQSFYETIISSHLPLLSFWKNIISFREHFKVFFYSVNCQRTVYFHTGKLKWSTVLS